MRKRTIPLALVFALVIGLFSAMPASATIGYTISFLHQDDDLYSPFSGPALIRFTWGSSDVNADFTFRLRRGGTVVHSEPYHLDTPGAGSKTVEFDWPAESVSDDTTYQVAIYRGNTQVRVRSFEIIPPLVKITSIKPDPFFPRINDGYRDTTEITFRLAASSQPVLVRFFRADAQGRCCGNEVERHNLDAEVVGERHDEWNGRDENGDLLPKGDYFVRVTATKQSVPEDVTRTSRPVEVSIARFRRILRNAQQNGAAFDRRSPINRLRAGGRCGLEDGPTNDLFIRCHDAVVRVFWHWNLPDSGRIEKVRFALIGIPGYACRSSKGIKGADSFLKVGALGHRRCRVDKARITYSFRKAS